MNKFKFIYLFVMFAFVSMVHSQSMGIDTDTPRATLDVQGNLSVRNLIRVTTPNAALSTDGAVGNSGTVLVSRGPNNPPEWKLIRRPNFNPFYYTIFNNEGAETQAGVDLPGSGTLSGNEIHAENQTLASYTQSGSNTVGYEITALAKTFQIDVATNNIVVLSLETIAQSGSSTVNNAVDFSCGIFVDDQLKGIRVYTLSQTGGGSPFYTYNLIATATGLSAGNHTAKVACKRRANINYTGSFSVGKAVPGATNLNDFMAKSSLTIQTYEKPPATNSIPVYN
ncbi:hypothetical protein [Chryseobacterium sp. YIM B08800]|uniref:hypothetical protein n=1 Tax=Chryseobacterium sp. YIM B08800 TaxID=2984136 RepID=UPI0022406267|nr:hypothetical protein [Chryseobacterium sp. YIM B08800]